MYVRRWEQSFGIHAASDRLIDIYNPVHRCSHYLRLRAMGIAVELATVLAMDVQPEVIDHIAKISFAYVLYALRTYSRIARS